MAWVITRMCRDCVDMACVEVCPVDCIVQHKDKTDAPGYESLSTGRSTLAFDGAYVIDGEIFPAPGGDLILEPSHPIRWLRL